MNYFVTGATGLIGRALVPLLLPKGSVTVLVRAETRAGRSELFESWRRLGDLRLVEGDVALPNLGLSGLDFTCDHFFHVAGLYDLTADAQQFERVNVGGTRNVIALLRKIPFIGTLHHLSSIAVAGDFKDTFEEDRLDAGQSHPHPYHRSKFESERLVRDLEDIRYRIYRPSAVVGHSETGEMDRIDGPYFLFEAIDKLRRILPTWMPLMSYQGADLNMVPVDWLASAIDRIAHAPGCDQKTFHLADPNPPSFVETFNLIADAAGAPRLPRGKGTLKRLMPGIAEITSKLGSMEFFRTRLLEDFGIPRIVQTAVNPEATFDTKNTDAVLGPKERAPKQSEYIEALWHYYARHLASAKHKGARNKRFFSGMKALITGASSGIGESIAKQLAQAGVEVVLVARREAELAEVAAGIHRAGGRADWMAADLSDLDECDRVVQSALEKHGHIDILVNNAGHSIRRPLAESLERFHDLQRVMQINFFAPARLIRGLLPKMRERRRGFIVNVLSAGAHMPSPRFGAYTSSKAALSQLGDTLAAEHASDDIQVTQAYLYWVRTPMMEATGKYEDNDAITPDEAAAWIIDGIVAGKQKIFRGTDARRYLLNTLAPRAISRITNVVYRIYSDDASAHPELDLDRTLAKKIFRGRPM